MINTIISAYNLIALAFLGTLLIAIGVKQRSWRFWESVPWPWKTVRGYVWQHRIHRLTIIALGLYVLIKDFNVEAPVTAALCLIAVYVVASDGAIRFLRSLKA